VAYKLTDEHSFIEIVYDNKFNLNSLKNECKAEFYEIANMNDDKLDSYLNSFSIIGGWSYVIYNSQDNIVNSIDWKEHRCETKINLITI